MRRARAMDTGAVVQAIPESLLLRPRPDNYRSSPNDLLWLTVRGIAACDGSDDHIDHFVRLLRWLAQKEIDFEPVPGAADTMPRVTSAEVREHLDLGEMDTGPLRRLYAVLQLDHWGLGGSGGSPDDWYVNVGPDIWRYRDVRTAEDCAAARESWLREGSSFDTSVLEEAQPDEFWPGAEATVPEPDEIVPDAGYYHVRMSTRSRRRDDVGLDLSYDELISRFVEPYREGLPIVIGGRAIPIDDLTKIRINRAEQPSAELRPSVRAERSGQELRTPVSEDWLIARKGEDVTDRFITEPPGSSAVPSVAVLPVVLPRGVAPYVDEKLAAAI